MCYLNEPIGDLPDVFVGAPVLARPSYSAFTVVEENLREESQKRLNEAVEAALRQGLMRLLDSGVDAAWIEGRGVLRVYCSLHPDDGSVLFVLPPSISALVAQVGAQVVVDSL